jgi:hypothetical protein
LATSGYFLLATSGYFHMATDNCPEFSFVCSGFLVIQVLKATIESNKM